MKRRVSVPKAPVVSMETGANKRLAPKWLYHTIDLQLPCGFQLGQPQSRHSHKLKWNKVEQKYQSK